MTSAGTQRAPQSRIAGLDLIRGIAIALVLLRHAWPDVFGSAGIVGVVAFFALSGYLITGILMKDIRAQGRVRYGRFYRNRLIRLFPPLLFMLAGLVLVSLIWNPLDDRGGLVRAVVTGITYTGNIPFDHGSPAVGHLWTLATEEQFYLVWPLILMLGFRRGRLGAVVALTGVAIFAMLLATMAVAAPGIFRIYTLPTSWAVTMVIGAAAKLWEDRWRAAFARLSSPAAGVAAVVLLFAVSLIPEGKNSPLAYLLLGPAVALVTVVLIYSWSSWRELPNPTLRPLLALGTISYAAYLWNYPIVMWLGERPFPWSIAVLSILLTIVAASASWWIVEKPSQVLRARLDSRSRVRDMPRVEASSSG